MITGTPLDTLNCGLIPAVYLIRHPQPLRLLVDMKKLNDIGLAYHTSSTFESAVRELNLIMSEEEREEFFQTSDINEEKPFDISDRQWTQLFGFIPERIAQKHKLLAIDYAKLLQAALGVPNLVSSQLEELRKFAQSRKIPVLVVLKEKDDLLNNVAGSVDFYWDSEYEKDSGYRQVHYLIDKESE